jgi:hypothetical protein
VSEVIKHQFQYLLTEFNVYVSGANIDRVTMQQKKEKQSVSQTRTKSKDSRKSWGVGPAKEPV